MCGVKLQNIHCMWGDLRNAKERGSDPSAQFASMDVYVQSGCPPLEWMSTSGVDVHLWSGRTTSVQLRESTKEITRGSGLLDRMFYYNGSAFSKTMLFFMQSLKN